MVNSEKSSLTLKQIKELITMRLFIEIANHPVIRCVADIITLAKQFQVGHYMWSEILLRNPETLTAATLDLLELDFQKWVIIG